MASALRGGGKRPAFLCVLLAVVAASCAMALCFYLGALSAKRGSVCYSAGESVSRECVERATVALTFDDGPSEGDHTRQLLDILLANNVKATFYILGKRISRRHKNSTISEKHRATVMRMVKEGHMLASHGFSHMDLGNVNASVNEVGWDIFSGVQELYKLTGKRVRHFRNPYLSMDAHGLLHASGLSIDEITCSTVDWYWNMLAQNETLLEATNQTAYEYVSGKMMAAVKECLSPPRDTGVILLQHDTKELSVRATQSIIDYAKSAGYRFVRMDECTGVPESWQSTGRIKEGGYSF